MARSLVVAAALLAASPLLAQTSWVQSPINGHWYRLTAPQDWASAQAEAVRDGANLATIRSQPQLDWVLRQFGLRNLWIGLNDEAVEGTFVWVSGEPVLYTHWCPGEPNNLYSGEDYVQITQWCIDRVGGWNDQDGTDPYPGLIEATSAPDGWVQSPVNGHWYRRTEPLAWRDGEARALLEGGHLATVRSQAEHDWLLAQFGTGPLWIGLNDATTEGMFEWTSGEPVAFTAWCPGEPSGTGADDDFVTVDATCAPAGGWNDVDGLALQPAVLERTTPPGSGLVTFGQGCAGALGAPVLSAAFGTQLLIGGRFDLRVDTISPSRLAIPFGLIGFDDQIWRGQLLPVSLTPIGMPGCNVYIDIVVDELLYKRGNMAEWSLPVPNDSQLIGVECFFQSFVIEPGANAFGAVVSNAGRATIGR
ncbi:MAG: hypothetical protein IPM29_11735 [Planctomycetes bacterium]|nr:hypothetical protein [Planctomycetota bacterium]